MIVVVGSAAYRPGGAAPGRALGLAPEISAAAAAAGARVELLARVGEDGAGDELLLALARAGIGHLAVLRDPARPTALAPLEAESPDEPAGDAAPAELAAGEPEAGSPSLGPGDLPAPPRLEAADISLGLRYLREYRVVVAVEPLAGSAGAAVLAEAAAFAGAVLIVLVPPGSPAADDYAAATVLEAPDDDADGVFAGMVGRFAAALDGGVEPADAFRAATAAEGWEAVTS